MKRFMFLSIGVLCLAIAVLIGFHVGSQRAEAQAPAGAQYFVTGNVGGSYVYTAILPNGDIYTNWYSGATLNNCQYLGNFYQGVVATDKSTWSGVKGQYNR